MKKLFITSLLMLATGGALAQTENAGKWSVTPMVGANLSEPDFKGAFFDDSNFGFSVGVGVDREVAPRWAISSGLLYSWTRYGDDAPIKVGRLGVPLMAKYNVWKGLAVEAGLQVDFRLHSGISSVDAEDLPSPYPHYYQTGTYHYDKARTNDVYPWLPVGVSYSVGNFVIDLRHLFGLKREKANVEGGFENITTNMTFYYRLKSDAPTRLWMLTVGYRFQL